jgi:hypothetical protein
MQHPCTFPAAPTVLRAAAVLALLFVASCGGDAKRAPVYPVKGKILVNGKPAHDCQVYLNRTSSDPKAVRVKPQGLTDENGDFQITTYENNDGAPEGEYVVTIEWHGRTGLTKENLDGADKLAGTFAKTEKTKGMPGFVIKVGRSPLDLPPFDLKYTEPKKKKGDDSAKKKSTLGPGPLGGGP